LRADTFEHINKKGNFSQKLLIKYTMSEYRVSGIWINQNQVITHYAFHTVGVNSTSKAIKTTKSDAIAMLEKSGNTAVTWVWNYKTSGWSIGETVEVVHGENGKYLRSNRDDKLTDNLRHLIDFDWIT
jgi:hypothetical protein